MAPRRKIKGLINRLPAINLKSCGRNLLRKEKSTRLSITY